MILIGAGYCGQNILRQTLHSIDSKINVLGFLDDDMLKQNRRLHDVPILGPIKASSLHNLDYDEILICVPSANRFKCKIL